MTPRGHRSQGAGVGVCSHPNETELHMCGMWPNSSGYTGSISVIFFLFFSFLVLQLCFVVTRKVLVPYDYS